MLKFGSGFTYVPKSATETAEVVEYDDSALDSVMTDSFQGFTFTPANPPASAAASAAVTPDTGAPVPMQTTPAAPAAPVPPTGGAPPPPPPPQKRAMKKRQVRTLDTNVLHVDLGFLKNDVEVATGDPIFCKCGVAFAHDDKLTVPAAAAAAAAASATAAPAPPAAAAAEQPPPQRQIWKCRFCGRENDAAVAPEEMPKSGTVDYLLEAPRVAATAGAAGSAATDDTTVVYCVDISGSMCISSAVPGRHSLRGGAAERLGKLAGPGDGPQWMPGQDRSVTYVSRLQSVQGAIDSQLTALAKDHPARRACVVTFSNDVTIVGDGTAAQAVVSGDRLSDYDELVKFGSAFKLSDASVVQSREALSKKIFELEEGGQTALVPALIVSIAIAAQKPGSSVLVASDGMSNIGIGTCETAADKAVAQAVFDKIIAWARASGVVVNVVSIKGSEAGLELLGGVTDSTGGVVELINPADVAKNFAAMLENAVVATGVRASMFVPDSMFISDTETAEERTTIVREIGNASVETELSFSYGVKPAALSQIPEGQTIAVPFQVKIEFTRTRDGARMVRVITASNPVTRDREQAEREADLEVLGIHGVQEAARFAAVRGDYTHARLFNAKHGKLMRDVARKQAKPEQRQILSDYSAANEAFEARLQSERSRERERGVVDEVDEIMEEIQDAPLEVQEVMRRDTEKKVKDRRRVERADDAARDLWGAKRANAASLFHKKK